MASSETDSEPAASHPLARYIDGEERYVRFANEVLGVALSEVQEEILRAVTRNQNLVIVSGNGVGKSYVIAILNLAFLYTNPDSTVMMTSGSYGQMRETTWNPMQNLLTTARENGFPLEGETKQNPPSIEFEADPEHYFRCVSGRHPDNLEGRHNERMLVVVDEADKPDIGLTHFDSAQSSITDDKDRMVVIGNPPRDESNSLYQLMESPRWHVIQFDSFESRNVQVDLGEVDGEKLPGLVDLDQLTADYEAWNREEWPGADDARDSAERRDWDERWYRRRLGEIPPDSAEAIRPFRTESVAQAEQRWEDVEANVESVQYDVYGVDVARGGNDRTVIVGATPERLDVLTSVQSPGDHAVNRELVEQHVADKNAPVVVDAVGEGSGLADELNNNGYNVVRFDGAESPIDEQRYYNRRTESYCELGEWFSEGGAIAPDTELSAELRAVARHIELRENQRKSSGTTYRATAKSELKKASALGRSPDYLDASCLAAWGIQTQVNTAQPGFDFFTY